MRAQASGDRRNACSTTDDLPNDRPGGAYEPTHSRLTAFGLLRREAQIFGDSHVEQAYRQRVRCRPLST